MPVLASCAAFVLSLSLSKCARQVVNGFGRLPEAFVGLFTGANTGKMVVRVAEDAGPASSHL